MYFSATPQYPAAAESAIKLSAIVTTLRNMYRAPPFRPARWLMIKEPGAKVTLLPKVAIAPPLSSQLLLTIEQRPFTGFDKCSGV